MAENKNKVIVYVDWINTFDSLTDEEAGKLIKHFFKYINDNNPEAPDRLTKLLFEPIKQTLKRDLVKWNESSEKHSINGRIGGIKSGEARKAMALNNEANEANASVTKQNEANEAVSVSDSVSVNDSVTNNVIPAEKAEKAKDKIDFLDEIIEKFQIEYEITRGNKYEIITRGKERTAVGRLLGYYKKKYPQASSPDTLAGLQCYFAECMKIEDKWLHDNMSPSIIISKFNEINNIIKNGTAKKIGTTNEQLVGSLAKSFGTEFFKTGR